MSKKILIVLVLVGILVFGMFGAGFYIIWNKVSSMGQRMPPAVAQKAGTDAKAAANTTGPMYSLETFIVNLAEENGNRYLRVTMDLEMSDESVREEIKARLPQIRNALLMILPSKRIRDISTSQGKDALRQQIIDAINQLLPKGKIRNVYFTEFVIQ